MYRSLEVSQPSHVTLTGTLKCDAPILTMNAASRPFPEASSISLKASHRNSYR